MWPSKFIKTCAEFAHCFTIVLRDELHIWYIQTHVTMRVCMNARIPHQRGIKNDPYVDWVSYTNIRTYLYVNYCIMSTNIVYEYCISGSRTFFRDRQIIKHIEIILLLKPEVEYENINSGNFGIPTSKFLNLEILKFKIIKHIANAELSHSIS